MADDSDNDSMDESDYRGISEKTLQFIGGSIIISNICCIISIPPITIGYYFDTWKYKPLKTYMFVMLYFIPIGELIKNYLEKLSGGSKLDFNHAWF